MHFIQPGKIVEKTESFFVEKLCQAKCMCGIGNKNFEDIHDIDRNTKRENIDNKRRSYNAVLDCQGENVYNIRTNREEECTEEDGGT